MNRRITIWLLVICACSAFSCKDKKPAELRTASSNSYSYDLSKPAQTWELPASLKEVSGNAWIDDRHLLVIEDLHPQLYLIRLDQDAQIEKQIPFMEQQDKKFDLEDVALSGDTAYALWSHGDIYQVTNWKDKPVIQQWETGLSKKNNTEGLCVDPVSHDLLVACKNKTEGDEKKSSRAIYRFDRKQEQIVSEPFLLIRKKDFEKKGYDVPAFYPSAIAVQPKTHDIYVLSTRETKGLAVYSYEGALQSFQSIDPELMPQPEGICFSANGDLYITTEGKHGDSPKALKFHKK